MSLQMFSGALHRATIAGKSQIYPDISNTSPAKSGFK